MKELMSTMKVILLALLVLLFAIGTNAHASSFKQVPFAFEEYSEDDLEWADSADDSFSGSTALGFSVTIGGASYSYFDMSSDGYVELLADADDVPSGSGGAAIGDLISRYPDATYLLAPCDDLDSSKGYYGYRRFADRAIFYYNTKTYQDAGPGSSSDLLNNFEVILYDDGTVQWNFNTAGYEYFDLDFFSGLYFGNTQTLLESTRYHIPRQKSYRYEGCDDRLTLDANNDCLVDLADLGYFALQWLQCAKLNDPDCLPD